MWPIMADNGRRKGDATLLLALAAGHTVRDAASFAGIGERTATRRIADPEYRRQVNGLRADMVQRALGKLADAATEAVGTLRGLLAAESESVKLGAARSILELGCKLKEAVELELRIATPGAKDTRQGRMMP
jgi:hypothetical protein